LDEWWHLVDPRPDEIRQATALALRLQPGRDQETPGFLFLTTKRLVFVNPNSRVLTGYLLAEVFDFGRGPDRTFGFRGLDQTGVVVSTVFQVVDRIPGEAFADSLSYLLESLEHLDARPRHRGREDPV